MISRTASIIRKEFIQIRRDPRTLALVVLLPAIQLLLFGYAINTVVDHIATVVFDDSKDADSRAFLAALQNSGYFDITLHAASRADALQAIDAGWAKVAVILPPDMRNDLLRGAPVPVQLVVDGSDPNVAQAALFAAGMVAEVHSSDLLLRLNQRLARPQPASGIELRPILLYNPEMVSHHFMIPGLIGLVLQFQSLVLTAFAVVRERERGTLEQLVVTPIRPWELMLGKIIPYVFTASAAVIVALVIGRFWFGVEIAGSVPLLAGLSLLFLVGSLGVGLLVSTVSQTQAQAMQMAVFILLPSIILSGFMFPREGMPPVIQQLGLLIPLTYFLHILRGIILKGVGFEVLWPDVAPLAAYSLAVFALSASRFRKRLG